MPEVLVVLQAWAVCRLIQGVLLAMGWTYLWEQVLLDLSLLQVVAIYTLGQLRGVLAVGIWWLGQWQWCPNL